MKECTKCKVIKPLCDYYNKGAKCKACVISYMREYKKNNKEKIIKYYHAHKKEILWLRKQRKNGVIIPKKDLSRQSFRIRALELMGNKCIKCGFDDTRALQIDHINGNGHKERTQGGFKGSYNRNVYNSVLNNEGKYQLLCANCNWIKRVENNEYPKKKVE